MVTLAVLVGFGRTQVVFSIFSLWRSLTIQFSVHLVHRSSTQKPQFLKATSELWVSSIDYNQHQIDSYHTLNQSLTNISVSLTRVARQQKPSFKNYIVLSSFIRSE